MKNLKFLILVFVVIIIESCGSNPTNKIDDGTLLTERSIFNDEGLLSNISAYQNIEFGGNKEISFGIVKHKKAFNLEIDEDVISGHQNLSWLFNWPICCCCFNHNGKPILIYFENGPFVNPQHYPKGIVKNVFTENTYNNWNSKYNPKESLVG
jgi:hypothetical protein